MNPESTFSPRKRHTEPLRRQSVMLREEDLAYLDRVAFEKYDGSRSMALRRLIEAAQRGQGGAIE